MSSNVYWQWVVAHFAAIRSGLVVAACALIIFAFCASLSSRWHVAFIAADVAFLLKWVECWLLERALVEVQLALEEAS